MSLNEFDIIQRYFSDLTGSRADTLTGIGDDCAVLKPPRGKLLAVSTDTLVAGRHFPPETTAADIGFKSLAVNLSDLAAMGAEPAWVSLSLTLPEVDEDWLSGFSSGFAELARQFNLQLIGGDLTRGPLSITVTIHGLVTPGHVLKRQGAWEGDLVCVSGTLGDAAFALDQVSAGSACDPELLKALNRPQPRVELGLKLTDVATSCIDISDGLVSDLGHICKASACRAQIYLDRLPCHLAVKKAIEISGSWEFPLTGGDDYELCFTLPPKHIELLPEISTETAVPLTVIGEIKLGSGVAVIDENGQQLEMTSAGFMHFS